MKSAKDYRNFLKNHAKQTRGSFWKVTTPIKAFKQIKTYSSRVDEDVPFYIHASETILKEKLVSAGLVSHYSEGGLGGVDAIANLIIPIGAKLHLDLNKSEGDSNFGKCRTSKALVHSIVRIADETPVLFGTSGWDKQFVYLNGEMIDREVKVKPESGFYRLSGTCESGIHFFLELDAALNY